MDEIQPIAHDIVEIEQAGIERRELGLERRDRLCGHRLREQDAGRRLAENLPSSIEDHARLLERLGRVPAEHGVAVVAQRFEIVQDDSAVLRDGA